MSFKNTNARCAVCHQKLGTAMEVVRHTASSHPSAEICVLWPEYNSETMRTKYKMKHLGVKGIEISKVQELVVDNRKWTLHYEKKNEIENFEKSEDKGQNVSSQVDNTTLKSRIEAQENGDKQTDKIENLPKVYVTSCSHCDVNQNDWALKSKEGCPQCEADLVAADAIYPLVNALELTAPASDALLKNRKNPWVQLAGHPGSFAPAGPHTVWKKRMTKENTEIVAYQQLMGDIARDIVPKFYREVEFNGDFFIEMEDLLQHFTDPYVMDIKMGTRTFLESEVKNPVLRKDLYDKMIKLDPNEPTPEEHEAKAITKLRYMQFREKGSSTSTLGFRIEAVKMAGQTPSTNLKKIKTRDEVEKMLSKFLEGEKVIQQRLVDRLKLLCSKFEASNFFKSHEVIGSSLLIMWDHLYHCNVWMIDFGKTLPLPKQNHTLNHRANWILGNHEDGYLTGLDNLTKIIEEMNMADYINEAIAVENGNVEVQQGEKNNIKHAANQELLQSQSGQCDVKTQEGEQSGHKLSTSASVNPNVNLNDNDTHCKLKTW